MVKPKICEECPAYNAPGPVWPSGPADPKVIFVGEAPGQVELEQGKGFVGPSGNLLWAVARHTGVSRDDAWITNTAKCLTKDPKAYKYCWENFTKKECLSLI